MKMFVKSDDDKIIRFRGKDVIVSADAFEWICRSRKERIDSKRYFIPNGVDVCDHFASNNIELENGGEICPIECAIIAETAHRLDLEFGNDWQSYDNWKPQG